MGVTLHDPGKVEVPAPRCRMWNRRALKRNRQLMDEATPSVPSMHAYSDIEPFYAALQEQMVDSMDNRKAEKVELSPKANDTHQEWTELIRTLSRQ